MTWPAYPTPSTAVPSSNTASTWTIPIQPWVGYGFGYESATVSGSNSLNGASASVTVTGWEYAHLRAGIDFVPGASVGLGLYTEASVGQYGHISSQGPNGNMESDITTAALHEWFSIGLRARVMP